MFGMGMAEIVVIAIVALLFLGPEKLPDAAKKLSQGIRDFRKHSRDLQKSLDDDTELGGAVRDLKSALRGDEIRSAMRQARPRPNKPATEPDPAAESADDDHSAHEPAADDDMPAIERPSGTVAKGSDPVEESPTEEPIAEEPIAEEPTTRSGGDR